MKLQTKINTLLLAMFLVITALTVYVGYVIIGGMVFDFEKQHLEHEIDYMLRKIEGAHQTLTLAGVITVPEYIRQAKEQLIEEFKLHPNDRETIQFHIISTEGKIVHHRDFEPGHYSSTDFADTMTAEAYGSLEYRYKGEERFCVFRSFPKWDWIIALSQSRDEIFKQRNQYMRQVGWIAFVVFGGALIIVRFIAVGISERIAGILANLKRAEEGDLTLTSTQTGENDEIAMLQQGINAMIARRRDTEIELTAARDAAEEATRAKSAFLANMSHELRTPLNAILGFAQIFQRKTNLDPAFRQGIDIIHDSGKHLLSLITDILDNSKIEAGKLELQPEPISLWALTDNISMIGHSHAGENGPAFIVDRQGTLPTGVKADGKRLRQVLLNLLSNALKFTETGTVTLRIHTHGEAEDNRQVILFEVADTGIGISEEQQARIFEPFAQITQSGPRMEGTGLGLSISRRLVRLMGGDLTVSSRPGEGSTFSFSLSLEVTDREPARAGSPSDKITGYSGRRRKILVVDDNVTNRTMLANMLKPIDFSVLEADNGMDSIRMAIAEQPHLIIMDLIMPGIDGLEATRRIRREDAVRNIPIIACSAGAFAENRDNCLTAGCNEFLPKPIDVGELFRLLSEQLGLSWQTAHMNGQAAVEPAQITPPASAKLTELHRLARYGSMRNILLWVEEHSAKGENTAFCERIRDMANKFQPQKIMDFVDHYLEKEKPEDSR